jgi:hypothetical protein
LSGEINVAGSFMVRENQRCNRNKVIKIPKIKKQRRNDGF